MAYGESFTSVFISSLMLGLLQTMYFLFSCVFHWEALLVMFVVTFARGGLSISICSSDHCASDHNWSMIGIKIALVESRVELFMVMPKYCSNESIDDSEEKITLFLYKILSLYDLYFRCLCTIIKSNSRS